MTYSCLSPTRVLRLRVITVVISSILFAILFSYLQSNIFPSDDVELTAEAPNAMYPAGITDSIAISPSGPIVIAADSQIQFSASMVDSNGDAVSGNPTWWTSGGTIDAGGLYTPEFIGNWIVSAESDGVNESLTVIVIPGQPNQIIVSSEFQEITVDETLQLNAKVVDIKGNEVEGEIISWTVSNGTLNETNVFHPWEIGNQTITAWWQGQTIVIDVIVNPGAVSYIELPSGIQAQTGMPVMIEPTCFDSMGNQLPIESAGTLIWDLEHGFVDADGNYTATIVGIWNVTINSTSGASGYGEIEVISSTPVSITLLGPAEPVPADQAIELIVLGVDSYGNTNPIQVPLSGWSASDGQFVNGINGTEWLPSNVGTWSIGVSIGQMSSIIEIDVIHGSLNYVRIDSEDNRISADETLSLVLLGVDLRGNTWEIDGNWSAENDMAENWLSDFGGNVVFSPGASSLGNWIIVAEWVSPENGELYSSTIEVEVVSGQLSYIVLDGHGKTITTDEQLDINPRGYDLDGNLIPGISLNWSINGIDSTSEMRLQSGIFVPSELGQYEIRAWGSFGTPGSVTIAVTHGEIYSLSTSLINSLDTKIFSGESMTLVVTAQDRSGNSFQTDVNWTYDYNFGSITTSSGSIGEYELVGEKLGTYSLDYSANGISSNITITVMEGLPFTIDLNPDVNQEKQGERLEVIVKILDKGGNELILDPSKLTISSTCGEVVQEGDKWFIELDDSGNQHAVTAGYAGIENPSQAFFDVEPVLFSGKVGSTQDVMMYGILLMAVVIVSLGILITLRRKSDGDFEWTHNGIEEDDDVNQNSYSDTDEKIIESKETNIQPEQAVNKTTEKTNAILTAMDGTVQGQTGWYQGLDGGSEYWEVTPEGHWNRVR